MKIEILGAGCSKCTKLYDAAKSAVAMVGVEAEVTKVEDLAQIMKYGVMVTPALVVDGKVKVSGKVPTPAEIVQLLR
jgi:small redox-active disulfide protein 2